MLRSKCSWLYILLLKRIGRQNFVPIIFVLSFVTWSIKFIFNSSVSKSSIRLLSKVRRIVWLCVWQFLNRSTFIGNFVKFVIEWRKHLWHLIYILCFVLLDIRMKLFAWNLEISRVTNERFSSMLIFRCLATKN